MRVVELGAVRSEVDPVGGESDSGDLGDLRSKDEREKTRAAGGLTRWVGGGASILDGFADAGKMASRTYKVKVTRAILLIWK